MDDIEAARKIAERSKQVLVLDGARLADEYFYQSVPLCVIDSVYSINVKYEQVRRVVSRYCDYFGIKKTRDDRNALPLITEQESTSEFLRKFQDTGIEAFTSEVFCNRQRTSARGGILKSEAVQEFAQALQKHKVEYLQDVPSVFESQRFENDIKNIPGQRRGISLSYFFMLAGSEHLIKPDRMIQRFLESILNRPVRISEAQTLLSDAAKVLESAYPGMTPRLLDNRIWNYQRQQSALR